MSLAPLFTGGGSDTIIQVLVGRGAPTYDLRPHIDLEGGGLRIEETGNNVDDTVSMTIVDFLRVITEIQPEAHVLITEDGKARFRGFIRTMEPVSETVHNRVTITAVGISSLLDKCIIPPAGGGAYVRKKRESDRARILWLLKTFGQPFLKYASNDFSKVQVLDSRMEKQNFANLTLRQAIEQVLAAASESANYYIDQQGRLHTFDADNEEGLTAPYEVNQTHTLAATEAPVANFRVTWDTNELINYYYVRGKNKAGSGAFSNAASINRYGRRQAFLDGPDSDTRRKARRLGRSALKDTKDPLPRISFTISDQYTTNNGKDWAPGQKVTMTSLATGWLKNVDRILRTTTTYISSAGTKRVNVEVGALRRLFGYGGYPGAPYRYDPKRPPPTVIVDPPDIVDPPVTPPTTREDHTLYVLDDFDRNSNITIVATATTESTGTSHTISLPDGSNEAERTILLFGCHTGQADEVAAQLVDSHGFYQLGGLAEDYEEPGSDSTFVIGRRVGSADWPALNATIGSLTTSASQTLHVYAILLDAARWYDTGTPDVQGGKASTNDPPEVVPSHASDTVQWFTFIVGDNGAATGDPTGYTNEASGDGGGLYWRISRKLGTGASENPSAYTTGGGNETSLTVGLYEGGDLGNILTAAENGAWWPGGNPWSANVNDSVDDWGVDGASLYFEGNGGASNDFTVTVDSADGELPFQTEPWETLVRWKLTTAAIPADLYERWIAFSWDGTNSVLIYPGDGNAALREGYTQALAVSGEGTEYASVTVPQDEWALLRWRVENDRMYAKIWAESDTEPSDWQVSNALDQTPTEPTTATYQTLRIFGRVGNDGGTAQKWEVDYIKVGGLADAGQLVEDEFTGDGTTDTFTLTQPAYALSHVTVDGIAVDDVTVTQSTDPASTTVTFDRAPSSGAVIEIEYYADAAAPADDVDVS